MKNELEFIGFPKMARLSREIIITEKIDGTNAQIYITEDGEMFTGSRNRWITPQDDNAGFAEWAYRNKEELLTLGEGRYFGEWWGGEIQRGYGLQKGEKRFSLFNVAKYYDVLPECVSLVPELYRGDFNTEKIDSVLKELKVHGSYASPGFMNPEGIIVFHTAGNVGFKRTIERDDIPKSFK